MTRAEGAPTLLATIALTVTALVAVTGCSRTSAPPEPPLPQPSGAAVLGCEDRQPVTGASEPGEADLVVADVVFQGLATTDSPTPDIPAKDRQRFAVFAKAPVHVPAGIDWVTVEAAGDGVATAWMPAAVWTGQGWVIDDYARPTLVLDLRACSSAGGLREGSYFLGGIVADGPQCVTLRVSTSADPEPQQRTIALGDVTC